LKQPTIKNRFVRSATWEGMAEDDGMCTDKLINLMCKLVKGEVGLIITGHAYVHEKGKAGPWQLGIYEDRLIPGLCEMTDAVHKMGGKIAVQLAHAGMYANTGINSAWRQNGQKKLVLTEFRFIRHTGIC
jgi:2,4-dienoyl-CoA reductase-like NADH-dependent reductase (Old Yellow Enzyme family)